MNPNSTAPVATSRDAYAPYATREIMSRPLLSQPSTWPDAVPSLANGPRRAHSANDSLGLFTGSTPACASTAMPTMKIIHPIASHAPTPSLLPRRRPSPPASTAEKYSDPCATASPGPTEPSANRSRSDPLVNGSVSRKSSSDGCTGTPDPRVQHDVQEVDDEVDRHEDERDHEDVALQLHVLAGDDRGVDLLAHAGHPVDHLDHDGTADEGAEVQAGDGQQREARRPQRVAEQDPSVRHAFGARHRDEVLLQRLDHVAAEQPHVDGDLPDRERDHRQDHVAEVVPEVGRPAGVEDRIEPSRRVSRRR